LELLNVGVTSIEVGGCIRRVTSDIKVLGDDHGKYAFTSASVDAISSLEVFLNAFIDRLQEYRHEDMLEIDMEEQKKKILNEWVGCQEQCPYCGKKCSLPKHDSNIKHKCAFHQPIGFGGVCMEATRTPLFVTCDEMDHQARVYRIVGSREVLEFPKHCAKCHPTWQITSGSDAGWAAFTKMAAAYETVWGDGNFRRRMCSRYNLADISWSDGARAAKEPCLNKVQVALVLDTTGSMSAEIEQCKADCIRMVQDIGREVSAVLGNHIAVELAFCSYKDHGDAGHLQTINFQTSADYSKVEALIREQSHSGGGDCPEDLLGAFRTVSQFSWTDASDKKAWRSIVLIADAPCHGTAYFDGKDNHPEDGNHMPDMLKELTDKGINLCFSIIDENCTKKMEAAFREHWQQSGDAHRCKFVTFSGCRDAGSHILRQAVSSIQALIQGSVAGS
jgi:hypothetical protein